MKKTLFALLCAILILPVAVSCKKEKNFSLVGTQWTGDFEGSRWRLSFFEDEVSLDRYYFDKIEETFHASYMREGKSVFFGEQLNYTTNITMGDNSATVQFALTNGTLRGKQLDVTVVATILESKGKEMVVTEGPRTVTFTKVSD